jgi:hypothetical protein
LGFTLGRGALGARLGGYEVRCGGGGGVAGARGTTLGEAATWDCPSNGGADGARRGGGVDERRAPPPDAGKMPREDGGGGMRELPAT